MAQVRATKATSDSEVQAKKLKTNAAKLNRKRKKQQANAKRSNTKQKNEKKNAKQNNGKQNQKPKRNGNRLKLK